MERLFLLEDDLSLVDGLQYALEKNGFALDVVRTVSDAKRKLVNPLAYDLLLLDVTLPDGTGFEICERIRQMGNQVPIIFLTAADEETNIIRGLDGGGDDYITKPFKLGELCSRIRALLRRSTQSAQKDTQLIVSGKLVIHPMSCRVSMNGKTLELSNAEYRLLCLLVKNEGQIVTRETILDRLWDGNGNFVDDNTLSVYIRRLRGKVEEDPSNPQYLHTVRGFGYQWKGTGEL